MNITIIIKDRKKAKTLLEFLKEIPYVELPEKPVKINKSIKGEALKKIFGIWKNRDISIEELRKKAWKKTVWFYVIQIL